MVHIGCVISNGYNILLSHCVATEENSHYAIPECSASSVEDAKYTITKRLNDEGIYFDFDSIIFESKVDESRHYILYLCHAYRWIGLDKSNQYQWQEISEIPAHIFFSTCAEICGALNSYFNKRSRIFSEIRSEISSLFDQSCVKIEIGEQIDSVIFSFRHPSIYVPFCLSVKFCINEDDVDFQVKWRGRRPIVPGDKSDIYFLFAETMALLLKLFNEPVYVSTHNCLYNNFEINDAEIIFEGNEYNGTIDQAEFPKRIIEAFIFFNTMLDIHGKIFGSISNEPSAVIDKCIVDFLGPASNYISRKESRCYYNSDIGYLELLNDYCDFFLQKYSYEVLTGITGSLLFSKNYDQNLLTNYIAKENIDKVIEVVKVFSIKNYSLVCQSNRLYLLSGNSIWIFMGDFHHSKKNDEEKLIYDRQARENALLRINRNYRWIYPIDASRFENLVAEIIECQQPNADVRVVGKTNNPDGGRDILIINRRQEGSRELTICQCKAYSRSVNKSHVADIRDTLDFHNANGFLLAVASEITTPLIDHLMSLSQRYHVKWWTGREIFKILRQYPMLIDRYRDIIEVVD